MDHMVEPPDSYSFRRKYLGGLPQTIVKTVLEVRRISAEHSSIEEILDEVKCIESAHNGQPWSTCNWLRFGSVASFLPVQQLDFKTL